MLLSAALGQEGHGRLGSTGGAAAPTPRGAVHLHPPCAGTPHLCAGVHLLTISQRIDGACVPSRRGAWHHIAGRRGGTGGGRGVGPTAAPVERTPRHAGLFVKLRVHREFACATGGPNSGPCGPWVETWSSGENSLKGPTLPTLACFQGLATQPGRPRAACRQAWGRSQVRWREGANHGQAAEQGRGPSTCAGNCRKRSRQSVPKCPRWAFCRCGWPASLGPSKGRRGWAHLNPNPAVHPSLLHRRQCSAARSWHPKALGPWNSDFPCSQQAKLTTVRRIPATTCCARGLPPRRVSIKPAAAQGHQKQPSPPWR